MSCGKSKQVAIHNANASQVYLLYHKRSGLYLAVDWRAPMNRGYKCSGMICMRVMVYNLINPPSRTLLYSLENSSRHEGMVGVAYDVCFDLRFLYRKASPEYPTACASHRCRFDGATLTRTTAGGTPPCLESTREN